MTNSFNFFKGLYPESNGIVGNTFYDSEINEKVNLIYDSKSSEVKWWNKAEPLWLTARNQVEFLNIL